MRVRLERLRVEGNDAPMEMVDVQEYVDMFKRNERVWPITVEECGADHYGRLYVIRDGRHRFVAAMLAGLKDIEAEYKEAASVDASQ